MPGHAMPPPSSGSRATRRRGALTRIRPRESADWHGRTRTPISGPASSIQGSKHGRRARSSNGAVVNIASMGCSGLATLEGRFGRVRPACGLPAAAAHLDAKLGGSDGRHVFPIARFRGMSSITIALRSTCCSAQRSSRRGHTRWAPMRNAMSF